MSTDLRVHLHHLRGVPVLAVAGDLDLYTAKVLRLRAQELVEQALAPALEPSRARSGFTDEHRQEPLEANARADAAPHIGQRQTSGSDSSPEVLVLDLSEVPFVDSSGLGAVVAVLRHARAHHRGLSIAGANPQLHGMLHLMGLDKVIMLHATAEEATDAASGPSRR